MIIDTSYFGLVDFVVFGASLLTCGLVGVYFAIKDRNQANMDNYYFGGKSMSPIAVGISLAVTYISALTVIGSPTESYLYGSVAVWYAFTSLPGVIASIWYYIPLLHRLQVKTSFQVIFMSFTVYAPSLALNAVTPISLHWSIVLTSGICTLYTTVGGVKAVVWTDVIQFVIMFSGSLAALVMATIDVGGLGNTWAALDRGARLNFFEFNPDPTIRSTFWTIFIGASISESFNACVNQSVCQRYLSCQTRREARRAALTTIFPKIMLCGVSYLSGCVAYAYFEGCDPLASGAVSKKDQIFPYLVLKVFRIIPGMAGLFVAAAYSGTMSTVSSGLNSVSAQILQDFLIPIRPNLSSSLKHIFSKLSALILGIMITCIAYMCLLLDGTVISMVLSFKGSLSGAVLGVFTLGVFFPWCNTKGALVGHIIGTIIPFWISLGGIIFGKSPESQRKLPVSIQCCNVTNDTCLVEPMFLENLTFTDISLANSSANRKEYSLVYAISFWYLAGLGLFISLTVGMFISILTGPNDPTKSNPLLFCPIIDNPKFPKVIRTFFRFGVPEPKEPLYEDELTNRIHCENQQSKEFQDTSLRTQEQNTALL